MKYKFLKNVSYFPKTDILVHSINKSIFFSYFPKTETLIQLCKKTFYVLFYIKISIFIFTKTEISKIIFISNKTKNL